jgi:hypothetical protein
LLTVIDAWLAQLDDASFMEMLPMLRRAFATLDRTQRRHLLDAIVRRVTASALPQDPASAQASDVAPGFVEALPLLLTILGLDGKGKS